MNDNRTGYPSIDMPWLQYYTQGLDVPPYKGSIYSHILHKNKDYPLDTCIQYFGRKINYKELFENVEDIARVLYSYGVRKGDHVALLMLSCPELVYLILALNKIGAVANMINPLFEESQIRDRINDTESELLISLDQLFGRVENIQGELCVKDIVVVPLENSMPKMTKFVAHFKLKKNIEYVGKVSSWATFIKKYSNKNIEVEECNEDDLPAVMVYSSGTTGASKGIVLINRGINATIAHYEHTGFKYERDYSFLQIIPTWFSTGIIVCMMMPLCCGISVVLEPVFNEENFSNDILKYKPNMIMGPTSLWLHAMKELEKKKADLSFITYPITGGEKILSETENMLNDILKRNGCKSHLVTGYGMCELGSTVTSTSVEHVKAGTAGYPILGVTVAAFNPVTNEECKYGERGEIRVLTPARMKEYFKRPDATGEFFWKDSEGREWGCTGDIGYMDEDGFAYIQGRATDYFTNKEGKRVYCFDIEDVALQMDEVYQCEAIGVPSDNGNDVLFLFVVLKEGINQDDKLVQGKIETHCRAKLENSSVPDVIRVLDKFPVKGSGKRDMEKITEMAKRILTEG